MTNNIEKIIHSQSSVSTICQNCKKDFIIELEDFNFYEKIKVPSPTWCPLCRAMRRLVWRNERSLYHNICAFSGNKIISMFSPETKQVVYDRDIWWGDKWDPTFYGKEYDFSKPFFEQYKELLSHTPLANLGNTNVINSPYGNHNADLKNCYLTYASYKNENVSYCRGIIDVKDSFDLYNVIKSEQCYEDVLCGSLYNTHFSYDSDECIDSMFLISCSNLQNCLGCINLRHKNYCIFNKQYTKEGYEKEIKKYDFGSFESFNKFKEEYNNFLKNQFRRFAFIFKSVNVTGDNIMNSKNSKMIFDIPYNIENSKYVTHAMDIKDSYDLYGAGIGEFLYEGVDTAFHAFKQLFAVFTHNCINTNYTYMCYSSKNLFGCVSLRKQEYCILNKKYSKEEYEELIPKIIQHMNDMPYIDAEGKVYKYGEFFPTEISPFYYNETIANEYYPITQKEAQNYGFRWKNKEEKNYEIEIKNQDLLDDIKDVDESIIDKIIECAHKGECNEQCTEAFKITESEFSFYKKMNFILPRFCPNCRHFQRLAQRNPLKLWHRQCMCDKQNHSHGTGKCEMEFETSYALERLEIVYCEKCYQQEVY